MTQIDSTLAAAASGLRAQTVRMRIAAENIANADSTGETAGADPFRRRVPIFKSQDLQDGARGVAVVGATEDQSEFKLEYNPGHPAADANGYVKMPNVNMLVEMMDMREAQRSYEANLGVIEMSRSMLMKTIDLLRNA